MKKGMTILTFSFFFIIGLGLLVHTLGFRINTSDSIPRGVYQISSSKDLKNAYVIFCPDSRSAFKEALNRGYIDHGHCRNGTGLLMKKVVATAGDNVFSTVEGVVVNGTRLDFSKPKDVDGLNRALPLWKATNYKLKESELLTMTNQDEWSFDGRYYGVIDLKQVKGVITPVWVKKMKVSKV